MISKNGLRVAIGFVMWHISVSGQQLSPRVGELTREAEACAARQDYSCCVAKYEVIVKGYPAASKQVQAALKRCRNEVAFGEFKARADGFFNQRDYSSALTAYEQALRYKTTNRYCLQRREACRLELNFAAVKSKADGLFTKNDYAGAQTAYAEALRLKPTDSYSQERVKACQLALKKPAEPLKPASYTSALAGRMVYVGGGSFTMGSNSSGVTSEQPEHEVSMDGFYMGETEVTVGQYLAFCKATNTHWPVWLDEGSSYHVETGSNNYYKVKGYSRSSVNLPIVGVSYADALAYCAWLTDQEPGRRYGLPTEAQWEYAARGGPQQASYTYAGSNDAKAVGWIDANSGGKPHAVKGLSANSLGLYDMSGNVWEWCLDWYASDWYSQPASRAKNAENISFGPKSIRVLRGGRWINYPPNARVANRHDFVPLYRRSYVGFRVVASLSN